MASKFIFITLAILMINCGQKPKENRLDPNSRKVEIDFADISINIPQTFQKFSADELIEAIVNLDSSSIEERERIERVSNIKNMKTIYRRFYMYVDTADINNTIIFISGKYLALDKEVLQYIVSNADNSLKEKLLDRGVNATRVDKQLFSGATAKILKLKYRLERDSSLAYSTQYLVTTNSNTFQIIVTRIDTTDYEDEVIHMKLGH